MGVLNRSMSLDDSWRSVCSRDRVRANGTAECCRNESFRRKCRFDVDYHTAQAMKRVVSRLLSAIAFVLRDGARHGMSSITATFQLRKWACSRMSSGLTRETCVIVTKVPSKFETSNGRWKVHRFVFIRAALARPNPLLPALQIIMLNESTCSLGEKPWNIAPSVRIMLPRAERTPSEVSLANFLYLTLKVSHRVE